MVLKLLSKANNQRDGVLTEKFDNTKNQEWSKGCKRHYTIHISILTVVRVFF